MSLSVYEKEFSKLKINKFKEHNRPHKVAMLLAVIELIETGIILNNQIYYSEPLKQAYKNIFRQLSKSNDTNNPNYPFYHLKSSAFWHLKTKNDAFFHSLPSSQSLSGKQISENIEFAYLDNELFALLSQKNGYAVEVLKAALFKNLDSSINPRSVLIDMIETQDPMADFSPDMLIQHFQMLQQVQLDNFKFELTPKKMALASRQSTKLEGKVNDWGVINKRRQNLGILGESFVYELECNRLVNQGLNDLAREVEWTSKVKGDGYGYDIRSFDSKTQKELFIEVKTTNKGGFTPFYITRNEVDFSEFNRDQYALYRVFDFNTKPKIFELKGLLENYIHLQPYSFQAHF